MTEVAALEPPQSPDGLRRELNLFGAVSMIVGIVIGSAIFLGVNRVAAGAGSPWLVALVWLLGGALSLIGALTYAELGTLFPRAGGEYVFLREGLGSLAAFLSGWTAFTINLAGSAAALAVIFAAQLDALKPSGFEPLVLLDGVLRIDGVKLTAAALIVLLALLNSFGIRFGGNIQKALTLLKYGLIILLAGAALFYFGDPATPRTGLFESSTFTYHEGGGATGAPITHASFDLGQFLGLAMVAALFAYDGWTNVVRVGSELRDPGRNLPKAMLLGLGSVMLLYILVSFGYMQVLGFTGFALSPKTVASDAARVLFGDAGQRIVAALILFSVFGSLNGITISGPRIYYAMSRDRLFPRLFDQVNRHHVPSRAIWAQAALSIVFVFFFDFDQLTDSVVFISFLFYALAAVCMFVLRRTRPEIPRPYKVPGYPVVPALFILASLAFVGYLAYQQATTLSGSNFSRLAAFTIVLMGIPVYAFFRARLAREARRNGTPPPEPMFGAPRHP
ncbi:MAG TPA: amino acid permease [Candidatus Thermoplasmatota archaeon]|nr:amino acid permease [Candidatus Thermoplasmatota archaeon]